MAFDGLKDLIAQLVLFQQMVESQGRRLIRDSVIDLVDAGKAAHGGHLDQGLFLGWVAEKLPLLQDMNPWHRDQWVLRPAHFPAGLGVVELD